MTYPVWKAGVALPTFRSVNIYVNLALTQNRRTQREETNSRPERTVSIGLRVRCNIVNAHQMVNGHPLYTTNVRAEAEAEMANATIAERVFILSTVCEGEFESSKLTSPAVDDELLYLLGGIFGLRKMRCQYKNSRPKCPCGIGSRERRS